MVHDEVKGRIIFKMLRKRVIGAKTTSIDTIAAWFPSHQQGVVKESITELLNEQNSPLEDAGGKAVTQVRIKDVNEAINYLESVGMDIPWGFDFDTENSPREPDAKDTGISRSKLDKRISNLEKELGKMEEAAEDWRSEARRRQRTAILVGAGSFILGGITSGIIGAFL